MAREIVRADALGVLLCEHDRNDSVRVLLATPQDCDSGPVRHSRGHELSFFRRSVQEESVHQVDRIEVGDIGEAAPLPEATNSQRAVSETDNLSLHGLDWHRRVQVRFGQHLLRLGFEGIAVEGPRLIRGIVEQFYFWIPLANGRIMLWCERVRLSGEI